MSQNKEASQFLSRAASSPKGPVSFDDILQPSLDDEAELRKLFATNKGNPRLRDIHVGLVDVFAAPGDIRITRARVIKNDADLDAQHVMALPSSLRREEGSPDMVENLEAFKRIGRFSRRRALDCVFRERDALHLFQGENRVMQFYASFHDSENFYIVTEAALAR
jgi:hypothetical protein